MVFANQPERSYPALLKEHATQVTTGTQSYEVVFTLPQPEDVKILPGMSAELKLDLSSTGELKTGAILPASAIMKRDEDGKNIVWLYQDDKGSVAPSVVTLGKVTTEGVEILNGVDAGDKVVVAGVQYLSADQLVKPLRWQRGV